MLRLSERPPLTRRGIFETVATFALVVAILYLGAGILVPLVLAVLLAFALNPMVELLSRKLHFPDPVAVIVSVLAALLILGLFAYVAATQLIHIGAELPAYQTTIANKLRVVQQQLEGGGFLDGLTAALGSLTDQLSSAPHVGSSAPRSGTPIPVTIANEVGNPLGVVSTLLGTLAGPLATAAIVVIFLIFLLMGRGELQERFIRLVSRGGYSTTNLAMSDASQRVGRYLQLQFFINVGYGTVFGLGLLVIGVPGAILWGLMIMLFRYIPFVGGLLVASIPMLLAFAVDSGWGMLLATVGLFVIIDLTVANVVEPRIYGASTGVSPVAILLSAMFWATLWGPVGLILATPMTVCLVVIGRYIPQFQVLETLLGSEPVLEPPERLYQRMLKGSVEEAIELAEEIVEKNGLESFQENTLLPALRLASAELVDTPEALAQRRVLATSIDTLIEELGQTEPLEGNAVVLIGGRSEIDESAARVVAQRLAAQSVGSRVLPPMAVRQESIGRIDIEGAEVVCLFYLGADIKAQTRYVARRLKSVRPKLKVIVAHLGATPPALSGDALRVDSVTQGFEDTLAEIDSYLDIAAAAIKLAGHQPFRGAGRGDDELGRALQAVAEAMQVPLATINLLDDERHRDEEGAYKLTETIAERGAPLVVSPGAEGEEFADNPYLIGNGIDFYAGVPLTLDDGLTVGSLVIVDYEPHAFGEEDLARLQQLAADLTRRFGNAPTGDQ
ncbi:AI-2E family transporter [Devosia sp. A16]|uniref:AI-2E family transporter n=1 Tax=Devosia sp. A16 TaxID=1736675 RepID=UPI0006D798F9|nr:AI-2E family transporter [Devosia sp. A16]